MEIAVADVSDDRRDHAFAVKLRSGFEQAISEARNRHTRIGGKRLLSRRQRHRCVIRVVPRLPKPRAVFGLGCPLERAATMIVGDRLHHLCLLAHARVGTVELEEQRRPRGEALELRITDAGIHLQCVEKLDAGDRDAHLHRHDDGVDRRLEIGELAHGGGNGLGETVQPQLHLGDDAERAFGADVKAREIVAGRRLARAASGAHDLSIGSHDRQPKHIFAHGAVAHGVGAGRPRRCHAANGCVRTGIDREEQARSLEFGVHLLACHAGLHAAVEIGRVDLEHLVHFRQVDTYAAVQRRHVTLERRAHAERDHRHARGMAQADDGGDLLVRMREHHHVGQRGIGEPFTVAVLLANRRAGLGARSEIVRERVHDGRHFAGGGPGAQCIACVHLEISRQNRGRSGCGT